ncbi:MAG: Rpn family recombination-promoting nuclease/putative transposase [Prevotellaceae bacterium]|jgi:predicted transposase/invertase (TIGR01784 family)|nr:Rpn family recombination-promoting nuclease/putative transposase [Prevotellaceae bacterium]
MDEENLNLLEDYVFMKYVDEEGNRKILERLNPLNDYLFMKYMGEIGDEEQLMAFLNAVLHRTGKDKIVSITILEDRTKSAKIVDDKSSVLDLRAMMTDGTKVNIEVQLRDVGNMGKRSLYYWGNEYTEVLKSGEDYDKLSSVININILGAEFLNTLGTETIPKDAFHTSYHLWEDVYKNCLLSDVIEIHFIDMVKFRRLENKDIATNVLHRWLTFFDTHTNSETIKKIIDMDTAIKKAYEKIAFVSKDKDLWHAYRMREMALSDYTSGMNAAEKRGEERGLIIGREEGIAIGEEKGREKGIAIGEEKSSIISTKNLRQAGFSAEEIAKFIGKTAAEINKILEEQGLM